MATNSDNRKRAFADVVSIEAWHDNFSEKVKRVNLHADVVFGTARMGGETDSPVRFRLSVKRAEIVVIIPETEPVAVDKKTVSRDSPDSHGKITEVVEQKSKTNSKAKVSASLNPSAAKGSLSADYGIQTDLSKSQKVSVSGDLRFIVVTQSQTADGHYRWLVEPQYKATLSGRPWDASKHPRLTLIDKRKNPKDGIPPTVRVEVHCRKEDLVIEDLEIKDETIWEAAKAKAGFKNRLAAAESYIRKRLSEEGLEVKNLDDIFGRLTLASTSAEGP